MSQKVTITLPPDLAERLAQLATAHSQPVEAVIVSELRRSLSVQGALSRRRSSGIQREQSAALHLTSPIVGLVEGILSGETTVGEALGRGDFGLGTLNMLDGEVVVLDGVAYQQTADGTSHVVDAAAKTPFMTLTRWNPEHCTVHHLGCRHGWQELLEELEAHFPSPNLFYAVRVEGRFESMRARAVRRQAGNRPLAAVAKEQAVFELGAGSGTLVGFWSPAFVGSSLTVPGWHLHFLSDDKQQGGHVLQAVLLEGRALIQPLHHTDYDLPTDKAFLEADLSKDPTEQLEQAEK
ncbi:hypothetical protein ABPG77_004546 [Micractinium sp. CCAP 211/92]